MDFGVQPDAITYSSSDGCKFAIDKEAISTRKRCWAGEELSEDGAQSGVENTPSHSLGVIDVTIEREFERVDYFTLRKTEVSFIP